MNTLSVATQGLLFGPEAIATLGWVTTVGPTQPATECFLLLEDGSSYLLLEDGVSRLKLERCGALTAPTVQELYYAPIEGVYYAQALIEDETLRAIICEHEVECDICNFDTFRVKIADTYVETVMIVDETTINQKLCPDILTSDANIQGQEEKKAEILQIETYDAPVESIEELK